MAGKPDPSRLRTSTSRSLSRPTVLQCLLSEPSDTASRVLRPPIASQQLKASTDDQTSFPSANCSFKPILSKSLEKKPAAERLHEDCQQNTGVESEDKEVGISELTGKGLIRGTLERLGRDMCDKEAANHRDGAFCVDRNLKAPLDQSVLLATVHEDAHESCGDDDSQQSSNGQRESEGASEESDGSSSSGKDMMSNLSLQDEEKGKVSPLRALSHVAHIKRKQDYLQSNSGDTQFHPCMKKISASTTYASSSKKGNLKQVQFQLEPPVYEKLMRLVVERHQGCFEKFILATLDAMSIEDNAAKRFSVPTLKKQGFSKWKRARFDQLKGTETQDLALAFKSLAQCTPNAEVTSELMHIPWQELNMIQVQKMLEETKKMLLINEKVHDCPIVGCGKRFTTPGHLRDHLNEHSGEQPYSCSFEDCPMRFRSKQHLCRHMKKHERAHTCTFEGCNKRFAFRERLIVHQKIHSDERPLLCPWEGCGKTFKWANSLHGHMRTHTGEKPFQCTFAGCGRLFGYKVDLTRHRRTHFGQPARANH